MGFQHEYVGHHYFFCLWVKTQLLRDSVGSGIWWDWGKKTKQNNTLVPSGNKSRQCKEDWILDTTGKPKLGLDVQTQEASVEMYKQCCIREEILNNEITAYPNYLEFFYHSAIFFFFDKVLGNFITGIYWSRILCAMLNQHTCERWIWLKRLKWRECSFPRHMLNYGKIN